MKPHQPLIDFLQKVCAYIESHEDIRNFSEGTPGKKLYAQGLAHIAQLASAPIEAARPEVEKQIPDFAAAIRLLKKVADAHCRNGECLNHDDFTHTHECHDLRVEIEALDQPIVALRIDRDLLGAILIQYFHDRNVTQLEDRPFLDNRAIDEILAALPPSPASTPTTNGDKA